MSRSIVAAAFDRQQRGQTLAAPRMAAVLAPADRAWRRAHRAARYGAIAGAALGALAGLALWAPASWLAAWASDASGQRLLLAEARGTLWDGNAVLVLAGGPGSRDAAALPGRLHWTLRPGWGGMTLRLTQACCLSGELALRLSPGYGRFAVQLLGLPATAAVAPATLGQWPLALLAGLGTPWNTLQLGGSLRLSSSGLLLTRLHDLTVLDGALQIDLDDVSSRVSTLPVLGSYRLGLRSPAADGTPDNGAAPSGTTPSTSRGADLLLDTRSGALRLTGSGQWRGNGLRFRGEAQAAPGQESALSNLLNIIGRRQGALSVISIG